MRQKFFPPACFMLGTALLIFSVTCRSEANPDVFARRWVGTAQELTHPAAYDPALASRSLAMRRQFAWSLAAEVFRGIEPAPGVEVPAWMSGYRSNEYSRIFFDLWQGLSPEDRLRRRAFQSSTVQSVFRRDWESLPRSPSWSEARYETWRKGIELTREDTLGALALSPVYLSPGAFRAYFENYSAVVECVQSLITHGRTDLRCFDDTERSDSVILKAHWARVDPDVAYYKTDAESLKQVFESESKEWKPAGRIAPVGALTVKRGDRTYALLALHIMTKVQKDWFWTTLWWAPDSDSDFGADRPALLTALWPLRSAYKLCVTSEFSEQAVNDVSDPSLQAANEAVRAATPGTQWCSNPYIETGSGNAVSSCIGCHQFAGRALDLNSEDVLKFGDQGRARREGHSPADYQWTLIKDPVRLGHRTRDWVMAP